MKKRFFVSWKLTFTLTLFFLGHSFLMAQHADSLAAPPHAPLTSRPHDPPTPVELFFGNNQLFYQTTVKKMFSPTSRFGFFSLATYSASYERNLAENNLLIEGQVSYSLKKGFGVMAGTFMNSAIGFYPIVGPQHTYASRQFLAVTIASFFLNAKNDLNLFGLYEYKPPIGNKWSLYNRLQFIYNHSLKNETHNRSYLYLRSGVKRDALVFGLGANLDKFGSHKVFKDNYGIFIRWEFK